MDIADAAAPPLGAWASIRGYFTPATLFLVVNLVIGTIALTSRATQQRRRRGHHHYHDDGHGAYHHLQAEPLLHPQMQQQPAYGDPYYPHQHQQPLYATPPAPAPLARTSSVLDRLRSFGLYRFRSGDFPPEYAAAANPAHDAFAPVEEETAKKKEAHYARSASEPAPAGREERRPAAPRVRKPGSEARKAQVARAPARVVEAGAVDARAEEFAGSFRREPSPLQQEYHYQAEEYVPPPLPARAPAPAPLARTSSVLDRLRSLGLYGFLAPEQPAAPAPPVPATAAAEKKQAQAHYDRSRSEPAREQGSKKEKNPEAKARMAKSSSSEARKTAAPSPAEATLDGESVDARAEAFIDSFRQQQAQRHREEEYVPPPAPAPLPRTSSVLDRLRSFGLYRFRSGDLGPDVPAAAAEADTPAADEKKQQQAAAAAHYGRSRSEPAREQGKKEPRMSKSSSSVAEEEPEADQGVDARADDFINKFRQQLQLQRLNSLLSYKEMLGGGGKQ